MSPRSSRSVCVSGRCSSCNRSLPSTLNKSVKRSFCGFPVVSCSCGLLYVYDSAYPYLNPRSILYHSYRVGRHSDRWIECVALLDTSWKQPSLFGGSH